MTQRERINRFAAMALIAGGATAVGPACGPPPPPRVVEAPPPPPPPPPPPAPPPLAGNYDGSTSTTITFTTPRARPPATSTGTGHVVIADGANGAETLTLTSSDGGAPCNVTGTRNGNAIAIAANQTCEDTRGATTATLTLTNGTATVDGSNLTVDLSWNVTVRTQVRRRTDEMTGTSTYRFQGSRGPGGDSSASASPVAAQASTSASDAGVAPAATGDAGRN